jgi:DNA-binding transcriptional MerR regulator/methylmalonyl-CoA mutase cobalamin-binding subunit
MTTIGAAARQTGVPAATLRKWEDRYGFPVPVRDAGGQRQFKKDDLEALARVARRIAGGERTSAAISSVLDGRADEAACEHWSEESLPEAAAQALHFLQHNDLAALEQCLEAALRRLGTTGFCRDFAIVLVEAVGKRWQQGLLAVYAEHIFSSTLQSVLARHAPAHRPTRRQSDLRVLLALPSQERHSLALALFQTMLNDAGIASVFLVGGLPANEIAAAAVAYQMDVVALSASAVCPAKALQCELVRLRSLLPRHVAVWVGGAGTGRIPMQLPGVQMITALEDGVDQIKVLALRKATARGTEKDRKND